MHETLVSYIIVGALVYVGYLVLSAQISTWMLIVAVPTAILAPTFLYWGVSEFCLKVTRKSPTAAERQARREVLDALSPNSAEAAERARQRELDALTPKRRLWSRESPHFSAVVIETGITLWVGYGILAPGGVGELLDGLPSALLEFKSLILWSLFAFALVAIFHMAHTTWEGMIRQHEAKDTTRGEYDRRLPL